MRRSDREVTDSSAIKNIIDACRVFRVAVAGEDGPYIVPLNFGYSYENGAFEFCFHCAEEGKLLRLLEKDPRVCFEMDCGAELVEADKPCAYSCLYKSVVGFGTVGFAENPEDKKLLLNRLMRFQTGRDFEFTDEQVERVCVARIAVDSLTAKARTS